MDAEQRIKYYLGNERNTPIVIRYSSLREQDKPLRYCYHEYEGIPFPSGKTTYYQDMTRAVHYLPTLYKTSFLFYPHDRVEGFTVPTLVKSRPIHDYGESILCNLNYLRHFSDVYKVEELDIPYHEKKNILVWRGSDTGYGFGNNIPYRPVSRQTLVEQFYDYQGHEIDVGLSSVSVNNQKETSLLTTCDPSFQKYVKPKMNIKDMLQHKFILSVEGNDVATNMKWILCSNSVAFCPPFTINSWILEEYLHPWQHYIPVRHDFLDLPEKVEWAMNHPTQCEGIRQEARNYMEPFLDMKQENTIMSTLLQEYARNVKVMD